MNRFAHIARSARVHRRVWVLTVTAVAMLAVAAGAFAWHGFGSATLVKATFSAGAVSNSQSQTCTAANNDAIQVTDAKFTGMSTSTDANLTGTFTIFAQSVYDSTTNAGTVTGFVTIAGTNGAGFEGRLVTVNASGQLQGLLVGEENHTGALVGNVSSAFSTTAGFTNGMIGQGASTNTAIVATSSCQQQSDDNDQDDDSGGNQVGDQGKNFEFGQLPSSGTFFAGRRHHTGPV
jgi:hypothetical protein